MGFETCFLRKVRSGKAESFEESLMMRALGIDKPKDAHGA